MIPTYLLCDSAPNKDVKPENIGVMGCRTRVVANRFGENSSIGRGNIANISINLPRLALETEKNVPMLQKKIKLKFSLKNGIALRLSQKTFYLTVITKYVIANYLIFRSMQNINCG